MKVLIVAWQVYSKEIEELELAPNGGDVAVYDIADGIAEYEDVTLFLARKPLKGRKLTHMYLFNTSLLYDNAPVPEYVSAPREIRNKKMKYIFELALRDGNYDIVNFQGIGAWETECIDICKKYNVPCITTTHLFIGNHKDFEKYDETVEDEQIFFNRPDVLISTVSNGERRKILREYPHVRPDQVFAIPNGIRPISINVDESCDDDKVLREVQMFSGGKKILVCSGTILGRKNQMQLVSAWECLSDDAKKNVVIVFCGKDSINGQLEEAIAKCGYEKSMRYIGLLSPKQSMVLYQMADGIVSVSKAEGLSLVFLEGMSCGKPLIFFRDSECTDDINDERVVTFIEDRSNRAVACAIDKWYQKSWDGIYIRHYVEDNFSRTRMIKQYVKLFHEIVKNASSKG